MLDAREALALEVDVGVQLRGVGFGFLGQILELRTLIAVPGDGIAEFIVLCMSRSSMSSVTAYWCSPLCLSLIQLVYMNMLEDVRKNYCCSNFLMLDLVFLSDHVIESVVYASYSLIAGMLTAFRHPNLHAGTNELLSELRRLSLGPPAHYAALQISVPTNPAEPKGVKLPSPF